MKHGADPRSIQHRYFTRILGMPVGMTVATTGATFIYKKTGNLWLCAFLIGTVACLMGMLYGQTRFHF